MAHPAESRSRKEASSAEVKHLEKEMARYKKKARAEKQELSFEQSVPSQPSYQVEILKSRPYSDLGKDAGALIF